MSKLIRFALVAILVVVAAGIAGARQASADDVEARIAAFWQRVNAMQPTDFLSAGDLGGWALNVIGREPRARISVADFRVATAEMQAAMDRAGLGAATPPVPLPTQAPAPLAVASASTSINSLGWYEIVGEVRNSGPTSATFVKVIATFYDAAGTVIDTDFSYTQPSSITPGTAAPFRVSSTRGAAVARYKLVVSAS